MARKKIQALLDKQKEGIRKWTYEVKRTNNDYLGKVKDEKGRVILEIVENSDYNVLTRLIKTSKYMKNEHDMRGLAAYLWDRNLVPMEQEEKEMWRDKNQVPLELMEISL